MNPLISVRRPDGQQKKDNLSISELCGPGKYQRENKRKRKER